MSFIFLRNRVTGGAAFSPASLFASGEEGAWYEPSTTTCFTDTGGTTPATYGQGVAYLQDLSGNGNHATQVTAGARPILARVPESGRRNELSETDTLATQSVTVTAAQRTLSFTGTGTITLTGASMAGPLVGTGAADRVSLTFTPSAGSLTLTVLGTVTDAQLELGASATTYQSVADSLGYDITEAGVTSLDYLSFDGSDDSLSVSMSEAAGPVSIFAAAQSDKTTDPQYIIDIETGRLFLGFNATGSNSGIYDGSVFVAASLTITNTTVLSGIARTSAILRANGSQVASGTITQRAIGGAINIGNRFASSTAPLDGRIFGLIIRASDSTTQEVTNTEAYLANRSGVTL